MLVLVGPGSAVHREERCTASGTRDASLHNFIETVWGRGYVLREPHEVEERIPA